MPKYWVKNYFAHGSFPEVGQKQKTERKKKEKKERLNNGNNNGQATHGALQHAWRTQAAWANFCHIEFEVYSLSKEASGSQNHCLFYATRTKFT